jgi:hypothetical protein
MDVPVKLNGRRNAATVVFAEGTDFDFLEKWREKSRGIQHPRCVGAIEIAELAKRRYATHNELLPYAKTIQEFQDHINDNPYCEVACLVFLKCNWFPDSDTIGLAHFRRTWCNNIVLDYLCSYPLNVKVLPTYAHSLQGAGPALLYFVVQVAKKYQSRAVWGEATQNSFSFYKDMFELSDVEDLIVAPRTNYIKFLETFEAGWEKDRPSQPDPVLEKIFEIEANSPPFVGDTVIIPYHQLVQHFSELPFHVKIEIAHAFGEKDNSISDSELIRRIFRLAEENGRLADLWHEIESRHNQGETEPNPFKTNR